MIGGIDGRLYVGPANVVGTIVIAQDNLTRLKPSTHADPLTGFVGYRAQNCRETLFSGLKT